MLYVKDRKGMCMLKNWLSHFTAPKFLNFCKGLVFVGMHLLAHLKYYNTTAYLSISLFPI